MQEVNHDLRKSIMETDRFYPEITAHPRGTPLLSLPNLLPPQHQLNLSYEMVRSSQQLALSFLQETSPATTSTDIDIERSQTTDVEMVDCSCGRKRKFDIQYRRNVRR